MSTTRQVVTGGVSAAVLAAAIAIGPVTHYFEPAPLRAGISVAYFDKLGKVVTICDGHTRGVRMGDRATPAQCAAFSLADRVEAAATVAKCVPMVSVPDQMGALADATFNVGPGVVCGSTLQRKARDGDYFGMCTQLTDATGADGWPNGWTRANGQRVKGLVVRRIYDRDWCLGHQHERFP